ncbi:hypothetical protein CDAR_606661 [Caerostris darwini]|uniref:Adenylate kinase isoenzyme 6 homolog n=1 Tax=Caerostris darwini TaxID=1538125 RepID=A0AAV4P9R1_9ARAC|nr:hypothetical protein CDAR_606661 [Caerostris darwini]
MGRLIPNILVTGTPGTGKSTLCSEISEACSMEWLNIGEIAKTYNYYLGYDDQYECHVLDEDKIIEELEEKIGEGGKIVDYHGCDFFPEDWFDIVFVLTTDNTILYDRLKKRGYSDKKVEENVQCEIFRTLLDEALESYKKEIVHALQSNTPDDMSSNIEQICEWIKNFKSDGING